MFVMEVGGGVAAGGDMWDQRKKVRLLAFREVGIGWTW